MSILPAIATVDSGGSSKAFLGGGGVSSQAHRTQHWPAAYCHEIAPGIVSWLQFKDMLNKHNLKII
jgi:hypothetical protein